jgi:chemotaxis signal transduction protein
MTNAPDNIHEEQDVLLFEAGGKQFALPTYSVQKALFPQAVTHLPFANDCVDGLINVDGDIAVQINFFRLYNLEKTATEPELILLHAGRSLCAITVDRILERVTLAPETHLVVDPQWIEQQVHACHIDRKSTGWLGKVQNHEPAAMDTDSYIAVVKAVAAAKAARKEAEEANKYPGYLQARICGCMYAIPIDQVKKIIPYFPMQKTCNTHGKTRGKIRGAIDSGNRIIPVLALESALALDSLAVEGEYIIVGNDDNEWALCVDSADSISRIPEADTNKTLTASCRFIGGSVLVDGQRLSLLDFSSLWNDYSDVG